jgi:chemotaxis protein CheX
MKRMSLGAPDIAVFSDGVLAFFLETTGRRAQVRTAYLHTPGDVGPVCDYRGVIAIGGHYTGSVSLSASRGLLSQLLLLLGESDYSDASHRDIVGEMANQMAGFARRHFGEGMHIEPPCVAMGALDAEALLPQTPANAVAIPLVWERYEAVLFVNLGLASR